MDNEEKYKVLIGLRVYHPIGTSCVMGTITDTPYYEDKPGDRFYLKIEWDNSADEEETEFSIRDIGTRIFFNLRDAEIYALS